MSSVALLAEIPSLSKFPVAILPSHDADAQLPTTDWVKRAARACCMRLCGVEHWINDTIHLSRLTAVPLASLTHTSGSGTTKQSLAADIVLSRRLHKHLIPYRISWHSHTRRPDLGDHMDGLTTQTFPSSAYAASIPNRMAETSAAFADNNDILLMGIKITNPPKTGKFNPSD